MKDNSLDLTLAISRRYLIRIDEEADFGSGNTSYPSRIVGEALIEVSEAFRNEFSVRLVRLGLVSPGFTINPEVSTGRISIGALRGAGEIRASANYLQVTLEFDARVVYEEISRRQGFDEINEHLYATPQEIHTGKLEGWLTRVGGTNEEPQIVLTGGSLQLQLKYEDKRGLVLIKSVQAPIADRQLDVLPDMPGMPKYLDEDIPSLSDYEEEDAGGVAFRFTAGAPGVAEGAEDVDVAETEPVVADAGCPQSLLKRRRTLRVQPVKLSIGGVVTGATAAAQFEGARLIWRKACIDLDVLADLPPIPLPAAMTASDYEGIVSLFTSADVHAICVFFSSDQLLAKGGGVTTDGGTGLAKVVITDSVVNQAGEPLNPNLLAHELGHVLHGLHPDDAPMNAWWNPIGSDGRTIMSPTGDPAVRNRSKNTLHNCLNADNDALITGTVDGCIVPDPS